MSISGSPSTRSTTTIGLVEMPCDTDRESNWARAAALFASAQRPIDVFCLPELFTMPYPCQTEDHDRFALAEPVPGPTTDFLSEEARRLEAVIVGSVFERRAPGIYHNTAVVIERDGRLVGRYRKMHIPDDPGYYEKFYFTPGDLGFPVFETSAGRLGVAVCWDQWFPEAARLLALRGAEVVLYPTAIGWLEEEKAQWGRSQHEAWQTVMRAHAVVNGLFVGAVNRTGKEGRIEFWGRSFVSDPYGVLMPPETYEASSGRLQVVTCDRRLVETARTHWPFLRDRRVDAYAGLFERFLDDPAEGEGKGTAREP